MNTSIRRVLIGVVVFASSARAWTSGQESVPEGLSAPDWSSIRAAYEANRHVAVAQQAYLKSSNTDAGDNFGFSVAVSGDTLVIGAPFEDSSATGVNGDQSDNSASDSGAAYVFVRDAGGVWSQQTYLKASNTGAGDVFGYPAVAVSGDTVVIGAPGEDSNATGVNGDQNNNSANGSGAAYVFIRSGTTWSQQAYLKASNTGTSDSFGDAVAIAGDTIVVWASGEDSSATGVNGNQADNSASNSGAVYVFVRSAGAWSQQVYLKASNTDSGDRFGYALAVSGDTLVVGAPGEDSNASGLNGNQNDNSASGSGAAYVFIRDAGGVWSQQAYVKASNTGTSDSFGASVAMSGDTLVVGARNEDSNAMGIDGDQNDNSAEDSGAAYVFDRSGTTWSQEAYLKASNTGAGDQFGISAAMSDGRVVVGAWWEDSNATGIGGDQADNNAADSGAAYGFVRDAGGVWSQQAYLKASNTGANDYFGFSVGVSGDTVVVGAWQEDSNATGVNGNQADNSASLAGAAYVITGVTADLLGDMNCDGNIDVLDINPFILALSDPVAYEAQYPNCDINNGDTNDDGNVDVLDINPFVALLAGG
ncbi:hypothetical protein RAS1_30340 [Phycisphaerae bacterium RAS1]|nr:hypothetical protein RAS1_30340 [Phycisphaerae bacterium RAS1]